MAGELVPLVMWPRYTAFSGGGQYSTIAMDVTDYQNAILNAWRGATVSGGTPTFELRFQESTDGTTWYDCVVTCPQQASAPWDPTANNERQYTAKLTKRWFRMVVVLGGDPVTVADSHVTCWAVGFLEQRER